MPRTSKKKEEGDRRRRDLAMIHIGKRWLRLSDEDYRWWLSKGFGVTSAKDLNAEQRESVIEVFKIKGWRPAHKSAKASGMHLKAAADREPQLNKIGAILADLKLPWSYADTIAQRMFNVDFVRFCEPPQLKKVIVALSKRQKTVKSKKKKEGVK